MEIHELLKKIERVDAPPHFEQRIMTELSSRKSHRARKTRMGLTFAGAASAAAIMLLVVGLFILPQREPAEMLSLEKKSTPSLSRDAQLREGEVIPIIEAVDYAGEIRRMKDQPPTIYILEHVSDSTDTKTKY
ncbi:hypothetical protein ACFLT2_12680 [Acidobacteriota bacterium]